MKIVYTTPRKNDLLAEFHEKASLSLNNTIRQTPWLKCQQLMNVNVKGRLQWYIVVDTSCPKEARLKQFARLLCEIEGFIPSCRICPHELYCENYENYFSIYQ